MPGRGSPGSQNQPLRAATRREALSKLLAAYPDDPGVLISLLLHLVTLQPGEAIYLAARQLHAYLDGIARGRALGEKQKRPLFMVKWEDYLDWPIADIRKEFRFEDGPEEGHWTWTFEASKG